MDQPQSPADTHAIDYAAENERAASAIAGLRRPSSATRLDSDDTLADRKYEDPVNTEARRHSDPSIPARPNMADRAATDMPAPVSIRPVMPQQQRRSTGAGNMTRIALTESNIPVMVASSEEPGLPSSDSSSDDDTELATQKSHTEPTHNQLSTKRLNQVRRQRREHNRKVKVGNEHFNGYGKTARDGRLKISVNETVAKSGYLSKTLGTTLTRHLRPAAQEEAQAAERHKDAFNKSRAKGILQIPKLNIVIMVIGSRGDIQPFLKIGKILKEQHGHRVRIATHPKFREFVEDECGLEFFSVGGDPSRLMTFMVKNPGLIPSFDTIKAGEVGERRHDMYEMFQGMWRACINTTDNEHDVANVKMMGDKQPFIADCIIANPPSFAHVHIAEKLGVPLHLVFTFPYSPTASFPHPLANIKTSNVEDTRYINFMSYPLVDLMTWQGLGDLVNKFRRETLNLEPVSTLWAPGQLSRLKIPITYLWSPGLVPKPADWGPEIELAGYVFLDQASTYEPPEDLQKFLDDPDDQRPLLYIGFGSIAGIDDPEGFARMIFDGVAKADVRAIISRGWGGMGDGMDKPDGVYLLDAVPHDFLFPKVDAVVHHGGAGTTAAGLRFGKPTMIVPFFGDQPFWAQMIAKAGAGARQALPLKKLDSDKFAEGVRECLEPDAKAKAEEIAKSIEEEGDGADNAVNSFHRALPLDRMRCGVFPDQVAVWHVKHTHMRLSALAADLLVENKQLHWNQLDLLKHYKWKDFQGPGEPLTGAGGVVVNAFHEAFDGIASIKDTTKKDIKRREKKKRKKEGHSIEDVIVMPGHVAHAIRGTSSEAARQDYARMSAEMNMHGEAAPRRGLLSPQRSRTHETSNNLSLTRTDTSMTETPTGVLVAKDVGKGLGKTIKPIFRLPSNIFYAMTLGLRNAPRLYGDKTVRPPHEPIEGITSGLEVAGSEFYHGVVDGVTGLVRIPYRDVSDGGAMALPVGIARGIGGLAIKPVAGTMGLPAYTVKGIQMSLRKRFRDTRRTERWIRRARMSQGAKAVQGMKLKSVKVGQRGPPDARHDDELERLRVKVLTQWREKGHVHLDDEEGVGGGHGVQQNGKPKVSKKRGEKKKAETF